MNICNAFPLHLHWDGGIAAESLFYTAKQKGMKLLLPEKDKNSIKIDYASEEERTIKSVEELEKFMDLSLDKYDIFECFKIPISMMQTREDLIFAAKAHSDYLRSQGIAYAETRFAPQYHTKKGLCLDDVIEYAAEGFKKARLDTGVDVRIIVCIARESDPSEWIKVAEAAIRTNRVFPEYILALDIACYERGFPPELYRKAFEKTFDTPLKRTVHAGEMCDEETNLKNIRTAIFDLRADGLGHAIPLYKDRSLVDAVVRRGIRLESCPISNMLFGYKPEDLCLDRLVDAGVLVTINPDDPAMIKNCHLEDNLKLVERLYGTEFLMKVTRNSINASWGLDSRMKNLYLEMLKCL